MGNRAFFANCVDDAVSVNLNHTVYTPALNPGPVLTDGHPSAHPDHFKFHVFTEQAAAFETGPSPDKSIFSTGQENRVEINFNMLSALPLRFSVTVPRSGTDYYFYIFLNTMVGQDSTGQSNGIVISLDGVKKISLQ